MSQADTIHPGVLELADLLRPSWPALSSELRTRRTLVCEGEEGGEGGEGGGEGGDGPAGGSAGGEGGSGGTERKPPWGSDEEFDPKRAWKLIEGLRGDIGKVKTENEELRGKVQEHEDASKSDQEKLEERASTAEKTAAEATAEAARLRVALKKGLTETQAKRLVGENEEELEKDADELLESFNNPSDDGDDGETPRRRPTERMRTGAARRREPDENDPAKLAEAVPRGY